MPPMPLKRPHKNRRDAMDTARWSRNPTDQPQKNARNTISNSSLFAISAFLRGQEKSSQLASELDDRSAAGCNRDSIGARPSWPQRFRFSTRLGFGWSGRWGWGCCGQDGRAPALSEKSSRSARIWMHFSTVRRNRHQRRATFRSLHRRQFDPFANIEHGLVVRRRSGVNAARRTWTPSS